METITRQRTGFKFRSGSVNRTMEEPNMDTVEAMKEVVRGDYAGSLDMSSYEAFKKSIDNL